MLLTRGFSISWTEKPPGRQAPGRRERKATGGEPGKAEKRQARQIHLPALAA